MINHHFSAGVYAKETLIPAGHVLVQHKHKFSHLSILASGSIELMVVMSVGERSGSLTEASSYDVGMGSSWRVGNVATTGGASLSVMGGSFGSVR